MAGFFIVSGLEDGLPKDFSNLRRRKIMASVYYGKDLAWYKRKKTELFRKFYPNLNILIDYLAYDIEPPSSFKDHPLKGSLVGYRDAHLDGVQGDTILVYKKYKGKISGDVLYLYRIVNHEELEVLKETDEILSSCEYLWI